MAITQADLLSAVETSLHLVPTLAGKIDPVPFEGVRGRVTPASHPMANLVGAARLTPSNADATIARVRHFFASQGKVFGWMTGPITTPPDLGARLAAAGLEKVEDIAGMAITDLSTPIKTNPDVRVLEATAERWLAATEMMAEAYGMPLDVARLFNEAFASGGDQVTSRGYLAYVGGSDKPVAYSNLVFIPDTKIVLLGGAATLPAHRGQGAYRSLVARRLADARARGAEAAVIQAVRSTSAPICAQLGLREICSMELFAWSPADLHHESEREPG